MFAISKLWTEYFIANENWYWNFYLEFKILFWLIDWLIICFFNIKWIVDGCHQWNRNCLPFRENPRSTLVLSRFWVLQSLVFSTVLMWTIVLCWFFNLLSFGHCIVCPVYLSLLTTVPLWYFASFFHSLWLTQNLQSVSCMVIIYIGIYEVQLQIKVQQIISRMACRTKTSGFSAILTLACYSVDNETR